jgi:hypothetical protein
MYWARFEPGILDTELLSGLAFGDCTVLSQSRVGVTCRQGHTRDDTKASYADTQYSYVPLIDSA